MAEINDKSPIVDLANFPISAYEQYERSQDADSARSVSPTSFPTMISSEEIPSQFALITGTSKRADLTLVDQPYDFNPSKLFSSVGLSEALSHVEGMQTRVQEVVSRSDASLDVRESGKIMSQLLDTVKHLNALQQEIHIQRERINKG